jgi:type III secretory pathway component EscR
MQADSSWEVVVSSLMRQLEYIEQTLRNHNSSVEEYLSRAKNKAERQLLEASLKSSQVSFEKMEKQVHDLVIYLCRAMTVGKIHKLNNLLGEDTYGVEQ